MGSMPGFEPVNFGLLVRHATNWAIPFPPTLIYLQLYLRKTTFLNKCIIKKPSLKKIDRMVVLF